VNAASRTLAAAVLAALAALLLAVGGALLYVKEEVGREGPFARRLASSLDDRAVRGVVSERTVDALVSGSAADLVPFRPLLVTGVNALVGTDAFRRVMRFAIADVHRELVTGKGAVSVEVERAARELLGSLRSLSPAVARHAPADARPLLTRIDRDNGVLRIVRGMVDRASWAVPALVLALLAAAGALALSRDRRRTTLYLGAATVAAGLLVAALVSIGGHVATGYAERTTLFEGARDRQALGAVWNALFGDLRTAALTAALGGLLVAALAAGARVSAAGAWLGTRLRNFPAAVRIPALLAAGVVCLLVPGLVARAVVVAAGALLLARAVGEAAAAVSARRRSRPGREAVAPGRVPGLRSGALAVSVAVIAVAATAAATAIALQVPPLPAAAQTPRAGCNGSRALCERRVNDVVWPATHNSYAASDQRGWYFANQRRDLRAQLDAGITALLLDVHWGVRDPRTGRVRTDFRAEGADENKVAQALEPRALHAAERLAGRLGAPLPSGKPALYLCHTLCELGAEPLDAELGVIRAFLERHPSDVLMLVVEDYVPPAQIEAALRKARLLDYAAAFDRAQPLPTLGQLVGAGRRLIVFGEKRGGAFPWYMPAFSFIQDTPLGNRQPADFRCARYRGNVDSPILMLNHWSDRFPPRPSDNARIGDGFLRERIARCTQRRGLHPGVVAVDFYERTGVVDLARELDR
jgi:hypothetical protein